MLEINDVLVEDDGSVASSIDGRVLGDIPLFELIQAAQGFLAIPQGNIEEMTIHGDTDTYY